MTATMNKEDVKLSFVDISKIDWAAVRELAGASVPQLAKNAQQELVKRLKNKELKKPYAKVGLIKGALYIRFKDGNDHLEDVLLVKGWKEPDQELDQSPAYQKKVKEFIDSRKDLLQAVETGKDMIKQYSVQMTGLLDELKELAKAAEAAAKKNQQPEPAALTRASQLVTAGQKIKKMADDRFNDQVHPPFEVNRTVTKPDDVEAIDVSDWGKSWFLQKVAPAYQKANEYTRLVETTMEQLIAAKGALDRWTVAGDDKIGNYTKQVQDAVDLVNKEFAAAKSVWAMSPIDNFEYGLQQDLKNIQNYIQQDKTELAQRTVDNAAGKAQKAAGSMKIMLKHLDKMRDAAKPAETVPSNLKKNPALANNLAAIKQALDEAKSYDKECQGYLKAGLVVFTKIKKELQA